jgi:hypothetical protein
MGSHQSRYHRSRFDPLSRERTQKPLAMPIEPPRPFLLVAAGNERLLLPKNYPFIATKLNRLLADRLPAVKLLSDGRSTVSLLAERWADEKGVPFDRFRYNPSSPIRDAEAQCIEWMFGQWRSGLVIFEVEARDAAAMRRRASVQMVPVRVVDTRLLVKLP